MTKIMLVEDDKSLREIYSIRLAAEGYNIVSAGDGEEALAMAVQERPDLILSDVMMPKISGFDMLDILRSTPETKNIKVIMMTALSSDEQRKRGENLGADRYLVKSQVGIEDVINVVHEVLGDRPSTNAAANIDTLSAVAQSAAPVAAAPAAAGVTPVVAGPVVGSAVGQPAVAQQQVQPVAAQQQPIQSAAVQQQVPSAVVQNGAGATTAPMPQRPVAVAPAPNGVAGVGQPAVTGVNQAKAPAAAVQPAVGAAPVGGERVIAPIANVNTGENTGDDIAARMAAELNGGGAMGNAAQ